MPRTAAFTTPPARPLVGASILGADSTRLGEEVRSALDAGADMLHIDVMDGHFVPNLAIGPAVVADLRKAFPEAVLDVHLMVSYPEQFISPFAEAGADHISFHAEVIKPERAEAVAEQIREHGIAAGIAVKPGTRLGPWMEALALFDLILVMSVEPGFAGQAFMPSAIERVDLIRREVGPGPRIQVDGGVGPSVAPDLVKAGADILVAASSIFRASEDSRASVVESLRSIGA